MKKKTIIILMAFSIGLCFSVLFGCSIFGKPDEGGGNTPAPTPVITELQPPESIRLDVATDTLYIADCSASGVNYYEVTQKSGLYNYELGSLDATGLKAEDGYFAIKNVHVRTAGPFKLTVMCKAKADDRNGAVRTFNFECVNGIEDDYHAGNCVLDNDTGLYSWPAVQGATGYKIEIFGTDEVTVVGEPQLTVPDSVESFTVTPLFDGYKCGRPYTVTLQGWKVGEIKYDTEKCAFVWYGDYNFIAEITENGQTVTKTGNGKELPYVPVSDSVSIRLTTLWPDRRPGVGEIVTFAVLQDNLDISLNKDTCELSWNGVEGATKYDVKLQLKDEPETVHLFRAESPSFILKNLYEDGKLFIINGEASVRITPITETPTIAAFSPFDFCVIRSLAKLEPKITRNAENGKISVSLPADKSVLSYKVTMVADGAQTQTVEVGSPDGAANAVAQMDLPARELNRLTVSYGSFRGGEGHYCFANKLSVKDYSTWILYAGAPEVSMKEAEKTSYGDNGFTIDVKFPEQLAGKGKFELVYRYNDKNNYKPFGNDLSLSFGASVGKETLKVYYGTFTVNNENALLFSNSFQTDITCLGVDVSADKEKISWQSVEGANSYCVERSDGGEYVTIYEGSDTSYAYSLNGVGDYSFRVTPCNDAPFVIGVGSKCYITKLAAPTVSMNEGELPVASSDGQFANIVTILDGEIKELSLENIRTALTDKASVPLTVRCTRSGTDTHVYLDSDDAQYTLHRIAEVNDGNMGLKTSNESQSVSWTAVSNANNYDCRLYQKSADGEYVETNSFSGSQTQMDCTDLICGEYKLEVKPLNFSDGGDMYLYVDGAASGTFVKEGIRSVGIGSGGLAFTVDSFMSPKTVSMAKIKINFTYDYGMSWTGNYPLSDSVDISKETEFLNCVKGTQEITFSIEYNGIDDGELNRLNTLKNKEFVMPVSVKQCEKPVFNGSYSLYDTFDNSGKDRAKVTLTPIGGELRDFESYSIIYKEKFKVLLNDNTYVDRVFEISETAGNELDFQVPDIRQRKTNLFALRITADKFTVENGEVVFYRSSEVVSDDKFYKVLVSNTLGETQIFEEKTSLNENGAVQVSFRLSVATLESFEDYFDWSYLDDNRVWQDNKERIRNNGGATYYNANLGFIDNDSLKIYAGKQIKLRVRRREVSPNGVYYDASCWYYLSFTVPEL